MTALPEATTDPSDTFAKDLLTAAGSVVANDYLAVRCCRSDNSVKRCICSFICQLISKLTARKNFILATQRPSLQH